MRDVTVIDDELALVAEVRSALLADGCDEPTWRVDPLLDERLAVSSRCALRGRHHVAIPSRFCSR